MSKGCRRRNRYAAGPGAALLALVLALPCAARVLTADIERVEAPMLSARSVSLRIDWPEGAVEGRLELRAASLSSPALGYRVDALRWRCPLLRDAATSGFACSGTAQARGGRATLAARWSDGTLALHLRRGEGLFALSLPAAADAPLLLQAVQMPASWLQPLLGANWEEARITGGTVDATWELEQVGGERALGGPLAVSGLGFDTRDGRVAAAGLGGAGRVGLRFGPESTTLDLGFAWRGGELLAGPLYATLPATPVTFDLALQATPQHVQFQRLQWRDPGVLDVDARATLQRGDEPAWNVADVTVSLPDLALGSARYLSSWLAALGFSDLEAGGALTLRAALRDARLAELDAEANDVSARDGEARFALDGVDGGIRWRAAAAADSELRWRAASVGAVALGPARLPLRSERRGLALRSAVNVPLLGGTLALSRFDWRPASASGGAALDVALAVERVDLAQLSRAFDWPPFSGTLSGRIPGVRYADEVLTLDGALAVDVFDGRVAIDSMTLERPFGVAPTMSADVGFAGLDLQPLTSAFGFGEITGRLDGHVRGLRVVDWQPVAFDADLHTAPGHRGPQRISRRAVDDLTRVGGGGIAAGLQGKLLQVFDTFGYARIGLKCRLANDVCTMSGVDSSPRGYTIVEGAGLPRVTVIGHQQQVDWPVLLARLKAATEGQAPIVD